jgi:hypothetical protein
MLLPWVFDKLSLRGKLHEKEEFVYCCNLYLVVVGTDGTATPGCGCQKGACNPFSNTGKN